MDMKKLIEERLKVLRDSLVSLQNNTNAHLGGIQELERLKSELDRVDENPPSST